MQGKVKNDRRIVGLALRSLIVLTLVAAACPALAEERPEDTLAEASQRFQRGVELFEQERYEASLAEFRRAYDLAPHPQVIFNIARLQARLEQIPEAIEGYQRFLEETGDHVEPELRREVEEELERLRPLVGQIRVVVERPTTGALIYLDDIEVGPAPLESPIVVQAGSHRVEVRAEGFLAFSRRATVAGQGEVEVVASLIPAASPDQATGSIVIETPTLGASVALDGEEVGTTPLEGPITALVGTHRVELSRLGYQREEREVEVALGQETSLTLRLRPDESLPPEQSSTVAVEASEPDVELFLDSEPYSSGPIPPGPHLIEVARPGFETWSQRIDLGAGEPLRLEAVLRPTEATRVRYDARARRARAIAWSLAATAVVGIGLAFGFFAWNIERDRDWSEELAALYAIPEPELSDDDLGRANQLERDLEGLSTWNAIEWSLLGLGLAATGAALALFLIGPDPDRYERVAFRFGPGGVSLNWSIP
jgi:tetratricopeptide (TPR) repeat protein